MEYSVLENGGARQKEAVFDPLKPGARFEAFFSLIGKVDPQCAQSLFEGTLPIPFKWKRNSTVTGIPSFATPPLAAPRYEVAARFPHPEGAPLGTRGAVSKGGESACGTIGNRQHPTFASLVGPTGWARLTPAIRERFSTTGAAASVTYGGTMEVVRCSIAGQLLAQLCRLVGTPLAPWRGTDVPVTVRVYEDSRAGGIAWEREYRFPGRKPVTVRSAKVLTPEGALLESVGGGFGMRLRVFERGGRLHFLSTRYFWRCGPSRVPLPRLLTPGTAHVVHTDEGGGQFRFTMTIRHPVLGETYFQDGEFELVGSRRRLPFAEE